ncbi:succinoglycan biosynthesis transport protein ExoP [Neorhizobium galegae]|uniref:Wzz/FepE/Etk N-terminal domain-containing protein n=1 Tax=Neorhizobium galegae TaxID=399 RepID=UPI001AEA3ED5|nr:Wzz/FepE/Etk N-terminal domain-containing protein [Neorhizobium galegae]MBP2549828.1 succinoglycan biosynthesis transport protein ExoP [Neorhizobium galegae]
MDHINLRSTTFPSVNRDQDSFIDLDRLFSALMRRIRLIGLCVLAAMVLAGLYLLMTPPAYTAMTQILIDENLSRYAENETDVQSAQQIDNRMSSAVEILKSKALALRVADDLKLADNALFLDPPESPIGLVKGSVKSIVGLLKPSDPPVSEEAARNGRREKASAILQQSLDVNRVGRSSVIAIAVQSPQPLLSTQLAKAYAAAYLTEQLSANFNATERASDWLQERLTDLNRRSQDAALAVEEYKIKNGLISPRGELLSAQQLSDLTSQLIVAQADTATASARFNQYKAIVDQGPEAAVNNAIVSSTDGGNSVIQDLRKRYQSASERQRTVEEQFGPDHPQAKLLATQKADIAQQIFRELQQMTSGFRNDYEVASSREKSLRDSIDRLAGSNSQANVSVVQLRELEQKAASLKAMYQTYLDRFEQATQQQSFPIAKARVISEAGVPTAPSSPKKTITMALSVVLGLFVGGGLATALELKERSFRLGQDVRSRLGLRFLGYIPLLRSQKVKAREAEAAKARKSGGKVAEQVDDQALAEDAARFAKKLTRVAVDHPRSAFAETLRNAKLACDVALPSRECRVIAVVSALSGEGKSTVAANLASMLGAMNKRTLLLDADPTAGGSSIVLDTEPESGLLEVLRGDAPWTSAITIDAKANLAVLPIASKHNALPHTSELLASPEMGRLMETVSSRFEYIVVDLAPLVPTIDAKAFSPYVDAYIFVAEWGETPVKLVESLLEAEPGIASKTAGVILNKTDMDELAKYSDAGAPERFRARGMAYHPDEPVAL